MTKIVDPTRNLGLITFFITIVTAAEYSLECQTDRIVISFDKQYLQGLDRFFKIRFTSELLKENSQFLCQISSLKKILLVPQIIDSYTWVPGIITRTVLPFDFVFFSLVATMQQNEIESEKAGTK